MPSAIRWFVRVWLLAVLVLVSVFAPGCTCGPAIQPPRRATFACIPRHGVTLSPPLTTKTIVPGAVPASFTVTDSGNAALSISLEAVPGRAGIEPDLRLSYSSSASEAGLGVGFSLNAGSAVTRCPKTLAIDGEQRAVQFDADDAYCLDGKRLIEVSHKGQIIEYRTFPDTHIRILGHVVENGPAYFEAWFPSGDRIDYGKTPETTGRTLLQSVQESAGNGTCLAPTRFQYAKTERGFDDIATNIDAPLSDKASPMLFDVDHDGLPEYVVGDSTPSSTLSNPTTEWRIAKNTGGMFAPEKVALLQEWSFQQDPRGECYGGNRCEQ